MLQKTLKHSRTSEIDNSFISFHCIIEYIQFYSPLIRGFTVVVDSFSFFFGFGYFYHRKFKDNMILYSFM